MLLVMVILTAAAAEASFKYPQEPPRPNQPHCPKKYEETSPWYEDPEDCNCYYVCDRYGGMVKMCCPAGLWFDADTRNCHYVYTFTPERQARCWGKLKGEGTTKQLRDVFIGRCWDYQLYKNPAPFKSGFFNCTQLFEVFLGVFYEKSACGEVSKEMYDQFLALGKHGIPLDGHLFWSGTFNVAQEFSSVGRRLWTLESTLLGYTLNELDWCGSTQKPGLNYDTCPKFAACDNTALTSFWARASEKFAQQARGVVTVMINGSMPGRAAFRNNSFLAQHEVINLQQPLVHTIRIWLVHQLEAIPTETCGTGSVKELEGRANKMGFKVTCEDNPPEVRALLCVDNPHHAKCSPYRTARPTEPVATTTTEAAPEEIRNNV